MHGAHERQLVGCLKPLVVEVGEDAVRRTTGVDHQHIQATQLGNGALDRDARLLGIGEVGCCGDHPAAVRADLVGGRLQRGSRARAHPNVRSFDRKLLGDRTAHSLARRRDECRTSPQPQVHPATLSACRAPRRTSAAGPSRGGIAHPTARILMAWSANSGREHSLPLLPSGTTLFDDLPADAVVLGALAPAVGNGVITVRDGARTGILIIRAGAIADALTVEGGVRATGEQAVASIMEWHAAKVSACRLSDEAMALLGPADPG